MKTKIIRMCPFGPMVLIVVALTVISVFVRSLVERRGEHRITTAQKDTGEWKVLPSGVGGQFRDFQFLDENHGWGVTDHSLWKSEDGGQNWTQLRSAPSVKVFSSYLQEIFEEVQFLSQTEGWILEGDYLLHTKDGGTSWQQHEFWEGSKIKNVIVRCFRFVDAENGWFVGQQLQWPVREDLGEIWNPVVYRTVDGGNSWERSYTGTADHYPLWGVWPVSRENIWAVGASFLRSIDGGASWKEEEIDRGGVGGIPARIKFLDSEIGWITTDTWGGSGYLLTTDGGKTWEPRPIETEPGGFEDVACISADEAWGVKDGVYRSVDGGRTWAKVLDGDYFRIEYLKDQNMILAGGRGVIAKYRLP